MGLRLCPLEALTGKWPVFVCLTQLNQAANDNCHDNCRVQADKQAASESLGWGGKIARSSGKLLDTNLESPLNLVGIGHLWVPKTPTFKTRLLGKPFFFCRVKITLNENDLHTNGFALSLSLKQRLGATQKWPIYLHEDLLTMNTVAKRILNLLC